MVVALVPRPTWPAVLGRWAFDPGVVLALLAVATAYAWGCRRAAAAGRPVPRRWRLSFAAGLALVAVALLSPVDVYSEALFSAHMVQHLLLELFAPPLLLLGMPASVALRATSASARPALRRALHSRVVRGLAHPAVGWLAFVAVGWGAHFSRLYELSLEHTWVHALEHGLFLGAGLLFWAAVLGRPTGRPALSYGLRVVYLVLAGPALTFLAVAILSSQEVLYRSYGAPRSWGLSPLDDQQLGAGIMWLVCDLGLVLAVILVVAAWLRHEERVTVMIERAEDALEQAANRAAG